MAVQVIKRTVNPIIPAAPTRKLRVAGYARISTDSDLQESSLAQQTTYYSELIKSNPDWEYAGLYADDGISGTQMKKRDALNEMLNAARRGEIDLILTKSISRLCRNTVDALCIIREMKELGVGIVFSKESLDTREPISETIIVLLSALAQAESQSISENVKWGIRARFQEGKHFVNCSRLLGFDKVDGELVINPAEAAVVRRIFSEYLNGQSVDMITNNLTRDSVPTGVGKKKWYPTTVRYILSNEKYAGDLRLQKYVVSNFLTHRAKRNTGEADQYYVENSHDPIVPREVFDLAALETARRQALIRAVVSQTCSGTTDSSCGAIDGTIPPRGSGAERDAAGTGRPGREELRARAKGTRYGSRLALQGRTRCSCGALLKRKRCNPRRWCCPSCHFSVGEAALQAAVLDAFRKLETEEENLRSLLGAVEELLAKRPTPPHVPAVGKASPAEGSEREWTEGERAAALFRRYHLLNALDWIHNQGKESPGSRGSTCYTLEQFIDATRPGPLTEWCDETVLRFVEGSEIREKGLAVRFRAGVSVTVPLSEAGTIPHDGARRSERTE